MLTRARPKFFSMSAVLAIFVMLSHPVLANDGDIEMIVVYDAEGKIVSAIGKDGKAVEILEEIGAEGEVPKHSPEFYKNAPTIDVNDPASDGHHIGGHCINMVFHCHGSAAKCHKC